MKHRKSRFKSYEDHNRKFGLHQKKKARRRRKTYDPAKQDGVFDRWIR